MKKRICISLEENMIDLLEELEKQSIDMGGVRLTKSLLISTSLKLFLNSILQNETKKADWVLQLGFFGVLIGALNVQWSANL